MYRVCEAHVAIHFWACALNNAATVYRPNLWVTVDYPGNYCEGIWQDPAITKFVPLCHTEKQYMCRSESGELEPNQERVGDMPAVFGYRRNGAFDDFPGYQTSDSGKSVEAWRSHYNIGFRVVRSYD